MPSKIITDENGLKKTTNYSYYSSYLNLICSKTTDYNGNSTTYECNHDGQVSKQTNAAGNVVTAQYNLAGQAVSTTDARGNTVVTDYDKIGRSIKVTAPFDGSINAITKTYYDKNLNVIKTAVRKNLNIYNTSESKYDNNSNILSYDMLKDEQTKNSILYEYDSLNNLTKLSNGDNIYTYTYDANNRLTQITQMNGLATGVTTGDVSEVTQYHYDNNGNTTAEQKNVYTTMGTEDSNMLLSGRSSGSNLKLYQYDEFNRLIKYNDGATESKYTYSASNLCSSKTVNGVKKTLCGTDKILRVKRRIM